MKPNLSLFIAKLLNFLDCSPVTRLSPVPVDLTDVIGSEGSDPVSDPYSADGSIPDQCRCTADYRIRGD